MKLLFIEKVVTHFHSALSSIKNLIYISQRHWKCIFEFGSGRRVVLYRGLTWYLLLPKLFGFGIPPIFHLECPKGGFLYSIWYENIPLPHAGFLSLQYQWFFTPGPCQKVMLGKRLMEQEQPNYHIVFYYWGMAWWRGLLSRLQDIKYSIVKVYALMWPETNYHNSQMRLNLGSKYKIWRTLSHTRSISSYIWQVCQVVLFPLRGQDWLTATLRSSVL